MFRKAALGLAAAGGGYALVRRLLEGSDSQDEHASQTEAEYVSSGTRILILGGGFAGLTVARELDRLLGDRLKDDISVLVVDRDNSMLVTPLLWPVANGTTNPNAVVVPIRSFQRKHEFHVLQAHIERIDVESRQVYMDGGEVRPYDILVIALGSVTQVPDLPGLRERALLFASPADALELRNTLIDRIELAHRSEDPEERKAALTFVVGGGGDTGVEVAATVHDYLESGFLREYPWLASEPFRVVVVGRSDRLVPNHTKRTSEAVRRELERKGIEVWTGTSVEAVTDEEVITDNGEIPARTFFWAAGITAPPTVRELPVEHAKNGSLIVDEYMRVPSHPEVYAIGDSSWGHNPETGDPLPPTAQAAIGQGKYAARAIAAQLRGRKPGPYVYTTLGALSLLGRYSGVAQLGPVTLVPRPPFALLGPHRGLVLGPLTISGILAWLIWHGRYFAYVPNWRNRVHLLADWLLAGLTGRETSQLRLEAGRVR